MSPASSRSPSRPATSRAVSATSGLPHMPISPAPSIVTVKPPVPPPPPFPHPPPLGPEGTEHESTTTSLTATRPGRVIRINLCPALAYVVPFRHSSHAHRERQQVRSSAPLATGSADRRRP